MTYPTDIAGTIDGGTIRTLTAPWPDQPDADAARAVLLSWCRANDLNPERMRQQDRIEIHAATSGPRGRYEILWREAVVAPPGGRRDEVRAKVRYTPLRVEPEGLIAGELSCGHVHSAPSPVVDDPPLCFTCDQGIDPATGRHPGEHQGGRSLDRPAGEPAGPVTAYRMSWPNEHEGDQAYCGGLPDITGMAPDAAHALVLGRLAAMLERRPRVDRRRTLIAIGPHVTGLRILAERHGPHATRGIETVCDVDYHAGTGLTPWPCLDYQAAFSGIVTFPPAAR